MSPKPDESESSMLSPIAAIGKVTFRELVLDKVLYNVGLCAVVLIALAFLAGEFAVLVRERVMIDFGLSALSISCAMIAVFMGSSLLPREFERRTALVALSRPISRLQFVAGKFLGLAAVIAVNWAVLSLLLFGVLSVSADSPMGALVGGTLLMGIFFAFLQAIVLAALILFFSSFTTASLAVIFTLGVFLAGHNVSQLRWLAGRLESGVMKTGLELAALGLPNLEYLDLGTKVSYGLSVSWQYALTATVYGLTYAAALVAAGGWLVRNREGR